MFSDAIQIDTCVSLHSYSVISDSVTLWTVAQQAPLSVKLSRQERWSGLSFPPLGDLLDPGIELESPVAPALAGGFFTTEPPGKTHSARDLSQKAEKHSHYGAITLL